jgi:hypothetical protein
VVNGVANRRTQVYVSFEGERLAQGAN